MNTNVNQNLKEKAAALIELSKQRLGSYAAVAAKCKTSDATITQVRKGTYAVEGEEMYRRIIAALELFEDNWNVVETTNLRKLSMVINDSRKKGLFMAVSEKAGSGKTISCRHLMSTDTSNAIYYVKCRSWGNRVFLMNLLRSLGINPESRYSSNDDLLQQVIEFFQMRAAEKPVLLIDQANSLRGNAFTNIVIHLFNEREGQMGMVAFGTEALANTIKKGVKHNKEGFDETDSRLGRRYITLPGSNYKDVESICKANGITNDEMIKSIFNECTPVKKPGDGGRTISYVEDHRRLKRIIQRELLKLNR